MKNDMIADALNEFKPTGSHVLIVGLISAEEIEYYKTTYAEYSPKFFLHGPLNVEMTVKIPREPFVDENSNT